MISNVMILVRGLITAATSISLLSIKIIGRNVILGAPIYDLIIIGI